MRRALFIASILVMGLAMPIAAQQKEATVRTTRGWARPRPAVHRSGVWPCLFSNTIRLRRRSDRDREQRGR
jgi:hypothetical protein